MNNINYRLIALLNFFAAVCFTVAGFFVQSNNGKLSIGLWIVAVFFLANSIGNVVLDKKFKNKE
ncbi:hypothetical protein [Paenibacillus pinistramenti]|uniref:hypothetical protein n=1 Tax=Paenibacillus pinistramenti TaxID=1768003 RepID=UPI001109BC8F|nr:hypothetical protein [Paenibacillus pinistramenti]